MTATSTLLTLPTISLPTVVLPGATVTLGLDDPGRRHAIEVARTAGRLAITYTPGSDTAVDTTSAVDVTAENVVVVASVPDVGSLPNGDPVAIIHIEGRARPVERIDVDGAAHLRVEPIDDPAPSTALEMTTRELRATLELIAELRRSRRLPDILGSVREPGALADAVATWADLASDDLARVLRAVDPVRPGRRDPRLGPPPPRRTAGRRDDSQRRERGHGPAPARVPAPAATRRDPQGTR